jgi:HPt (histidine-containing phosphotransfer) domain-containing protein
MTIIFQKTISKSLEDLTTAIENGNIELVKQIAHKIKPSLHNLEIKSIYKEIEELETSELNLNEIKTKVKKLNSTLMLVIEDMQNME